MGFTSLNQACLQARKKSSEQKGYFSQIIFDNLFFLCLWDTVWLKILRCEFKHSGGWTVFQIRYDGTTDFYQDWESYRHGFGRPEGEYWLGLDSVHLLTSRAPTRLRIDLNDAAGHTAYVEHENFFIDDESESYKCVI